MSMVNSGSGLAYRNYIYAGNDPIAVDTITSSGETLQYFETGPQRSIDAITNSSGQVLVNESFSAYGVRRDPMTWSGAASSADLATSASITQHGYTFQRALGEAMNLNDMVGRVEDAGIGRFMSADPTQPHQLNPQAYNPYSYTLNNPLTYVDPSGFGSSCNDLWDVQTVSYGGSLLGMSFFLVSSSSADCASMSLESGWNRTPGTDGAGGRAGGSAGKSPKPMPLPQSSACTKYARQAAFVKANLPDANRIANLLDTTPGNIPGLSGYESNWGNGPLIAAGSNNYFSLKAGPAFATLNFVGTTTLGANTFWNYPGPGMPGSGLAFADSYFGARVFSAQSGQAFAQALDSGGKYNTGSSYEKTLESTINQATSVMGCP